MTSKTESRLLLTAALACLSRAAFAGQHNPPHPLDRFLFESFAMVIDPNVSMTLNSTVQTTTSQNFLLTVAGGPGKAGDVVALYAPPNVDPNTVLFVKYIQGNQIPGYVGTGNGTYTFTLLNLRTDSKFVLITGGLGFNLQAPNFTIIAQSPIITNTNVNQPTQGHLAMTQDPTIMLISWTTKNSAKPTAKWGLASGQYTGLSTATTQTYTREQICGAPANGTGYFDPGSLHTAAMTGLQPSTKYYYVYGSDADEYAQEAFFTTMPPIGDQSLVKIIMSADMGQSQVDGANEPGKDEPPSIAVTNAIASEIANGYTLNVHLGDLSYADGYLADWDNYYEQISLFTRYLPFMTVPGNHERDTYNSGDAFTFPGSNDARGECGIVYSRRQSMPQQPGQDKSVMVAAGSWGLRSYYSFDYGPVHFLQYDSESPFAPGTVQHQWIEDDLKSVDRSKTPWLLVGTHRMFYCDSSDYRSDDDGDQTMAARMRASLEDLFNAYKISAFTTIPGETEVGHPLVSVSVGSGPIDAMFFGHMHSYARTCPVYKNQCKPSEGEQSTGTLNILNGNTTAVYYEPSAPIYFLIGNAGRQVGTPDFLEDPQPEIYANFNLNYGFVKLRANATHLISEAVQSPAGYIMDAVTIVKNNGTTPAPLSKHDLVQGALSNLTRDALTQPLQLPGALSDLTSAISG